jgi:tetratricopeptide (TPR) repeat protein
MELKKFLLLCVAVVSTAILTAQTQLPQPSPSAHLKQTVGLTDIEIVYSSPAVNGRKIYGDLVPYGEMWRAGANAPTTISFSKDVSIDGKAVPAGKYALYVTPMEGNAWMVTLNSDPNAQPWARKADNDVANVKAMVKDVAHHERLAYSVSDFNDKKATINMAWDKKMVGFDVGLNTAEQAMANINRSYSNGWRDYFNAARYLHSAGEYDEAMKQIDRSLALDENWFNVWIKAQVLNGKGMNKEAYEHAQKSLALGNENPDGFWYKADVEAALASWKKN